MVSLGNMFYGLANSEEENLKDRDVAAWKKKSQALRPPALPFPGEGREDQGFKASWATCDNVCFTCSDSTYVCLSHVCLVHTKAKRGCEVTLLRLQLQTVVNRWVGIRN